MSNRPTNDPFWTDGDSAKQVEPSTGFKTTGWQYKDKVPLEYFNWLFYNIFNFIKWLMGGSAYIKQVSSANYTILDDDNYSVFLITTGNSDRTITLPLIANNKSRKMKFKKVDSGTGKVILARAGSNTIDGATSLNIYKQDDYVEIANDETSDWKKVSHYSGINFLIQDYVQRGYIGSSGQQQAGHIFVKDEIGTDLALYLAASSGALLTDEVGNFNLTNTGTVVVCDGTGTKKNIFGSAKGFYFDGGANSYLSQATLLDGISNSFYLSCYIMPDDGQPGADQIIWERYNDSNNYLQLLLHTDGSIYFVAKVNGTVHTVSSTFQLSNGAQTYPILVQVCKDATYGMRLWINTVFQRCNGASTAKAALTTTTGAFYIGANNAGASRYTGVVDMLRVQNAVPSFFYLQKEYSVKIAIPTELQGKYFNIFGYIKDSSNIEKESKLHSIFLMQDNSFLYRFSDLNNFENTDSMKIIGG